MLRCLMPINQRISLANQAQQAGDDCSKMFVDSEDHFVHLNISEKSSNKALTFILFVIPTILN